MITMDDSRPDELPSMTGSFSNRSILQLNRIGIQNFQEGRFVEASECFLSAMQILKSTVSLEWKQGKLGDDDRSYLDLSDTSQEYQYNRTTRLHAILQPMDICNLYFPFQCESSVQSKVIHSRNGLVSFVLIFNLATTIHHRALVFDEQDHKNINSTTEPTVSRQILIDRAFRLYQCALEGVSFHVYPTGLENTVHFRQLVLGQQLLLSTSHNMGLLLSTDEKTVSWLEENAMNSNNSNVASSGSNSDSLPSSYRCFQVVFATLHSLGDYYGIQQSDFPATFELQLVIDTALEGLQRYETRESESGSNINPWSDHHDTAPCA